MRALKGAEVSVKIKEQATQMMEGLEGPTLKLTIVRVGGKPDNVSYERETVKEMENFGLRIRTYVFPEQINDNDFKAEFSTINRDPNVSGILLLRPLSKQIVETDIGEVIDLEKDLNEVSPANIARVLTGDKTGLAPRIAEAVVEVLKVSEIDMTGKNVTIVGRSTVARRPLSMLMLKKNATVTICHTRTRDLEAECRRTEILVAAVGKAKILDGRHVGQDVVVINVGINVDENGKICGNVDPQSTESMAPMATLTPGDVGAVTTAVLAKYLVLTGQKQRRSQMEPLLIPAFSSY